MKKIHYKDDGKTKRNEFKGTFTNGKLNGEGEVITYDENGNIKRKQRGTFIFGGLTEGEIIFYYKDGNKEHETKGTFKNFILTKGEVITYDKHGNIKTRKKT